jgi:hypothetical protein
MRLIRTEILTVLALLSLPGVCTAQTAPAEIRFNQDVLPIVAENCLACHGFDQAARQAELRLDMPSGAIVAIVPGEPDESELIQRINSTDPDFVMPPPDSGGSLTELQRRTLRRWIAQGANFEKHWAFLPPTRSAPPAAPDAAHPIDRFIRARLAAENLRPSPPATRAVLIRRLSLDLTGLPPSPEEVDAFVNDERADAYQRVVDRLLASPHFGERWARWWLDLAHYADSDGYLQDFARPVAWRYRQWVVDAFNRDLPFDRFTIEQLAGDLLPEATDSQRIATGFLRNTLSNREGGADLEEYRVKQVVDRTITVGTTWLALTVGCTQCHDHKFDALSQREFYQLYAFFNAADEVNFNAPLPGERGPWERAKQAYDRKRAELLAPAADALAEMQADWERRLLDAETNPDAPFAWQRALEVLGLVWGQGQGEGQLEGINIIKTPPALRTQQQRDRLLDYFLARAPAEYRERLAEINAGDLRKQLESLEQKLPAMSRAPAMMQSVVRRATHIHLRGDFRRPGDEVAPRTPTILPPLDAKNDADRLAFAKWLVSPRHPLTARVTVNRLWQELFGRGIVVTSDNFGVRGDLPSHPELLDWLALEFQRRRWSVKQMLRVIVMSQTYRQSSGVRPELAERDPDNKLLARQRRLRLSAEAVRDSMLAVSGLLCRKIGGPSVRPPQPDSVSTEAYYNTWNASEGEDRYRRGIYTFLQRTTPFAQFVTFDLPDTSRSCTRRERSNTPLQALQLLNDPVFVEAARALAERVLADSAGEDDQQLDGAFRLTLGRTPLPDESQRLLDYLHQQQQAFTADPEAAALLIGDNLKNTQTTDAAEHAAWTAVCSVLLNLDEFLNRE